MTAAAACADGAAWVSARRLEPAALGVPVAFEDQPQAIQGQVLVVMADGVQFGEQQRRGMPGGDYRDLIPQIAGESLDVLPDACDQTVDEPGETEYRSRLHALDGVLAHHRSGA